MDLFDDDRDDDGGHDPFDLSSPEGQTYALLAGLFDDHVTCECWCPCEREATEPETVCDRCRSGRHDPS